MKDILTFKELQATFHLPLKEATKYLRVHHKTLKHAKNHHNISVWPYQTLKSMKRVRNSVVTDTSGAFTLDTMSNIRDDITILMMRMYKTPQSSVVMEFTNIRKIVKQLILKQKCSGVNSA